MESVRHQKDGSSNKMQAPQSTTNLFRGASHKWWKPVCDTGNRPHSLLSPEKRWQKRNLGTVVLQKKKSQFADYFINLTTEEVQVSPVSNLDNPDSGHTLVWETTETDTVTSVLRTCHGCKMVPEHSPGVTLWKSWDKMVISSFSTATTPSTLRKIKGDPRAHDDCCDSGAWSWQSKYPGCQVAVQILTFSSASKIYNSVTSLLWKWQVKKEKVMFKEGWNKRKLV